MPSAETFPALESYGSAVHPMLVDEMRDFQGALDSQIRDVTAYYMHKQEEARLEEERRYGAAQQPRVSYLTPPDYQSPPQQFEPSQSYHDPHAYQGAEAVGAHQEVPQQQQWYQAPVQAHGQHEYEQSTSQYPMHGSQLVSVDPHHASMSQDHSQQYTMFSSDTSHDTGQTHGQYHSVAAPPAGQGYYHGHEMPPPPAPASRSQLWHVPAGHVEGELMYPTAPVDYPPPPPSQPVHPATPVEYIPPPPPSQPMYQTTPYGHASTPSLSRSSSMTQMRQHPLVPQQQQQPMMMTMQYSLQESWNTFVQHQLPTPVAPQPQPQQQQHQQGYGGQ